MMRAFGTGLPIWTAIEVGILYAYANGYAPWLTFARNPFCLFALAPAFSGARGPPHSEHADNPGFRRLRL